MNRKLDLSNREKWEGRSLKELKEELKQLEGIDFDFAFKNLKKTIVDLELKAALYQGPNNK